MPTYSVMYRVDMPPPGGKAPADVDLSDYQAVATVEAPDLDALFRDMNAVDGTETCCKLRVRSMSVGDVAIDTAMGEAWCCAGFGWEPVTTRGAVRCA
jgi:hypothetical protein